MKEVWPNKMKGGSPHHSIRRPDKHLDRHDPPAGSLLRLLVLHKRPMVAVGRSRNEAEAGGGSCTSDSVPAETQGSNTVTPLLRSYG